ncbi:MAG: glycosyl hydrolase [Candidatus Omnitrophota bacterium]
MKKYSILIAVILILLVVSGIMFYAANNASYCLTGAFLSDVPLAKDISDFKNSYGRQPRLVMIFISWNRFPDNRTIEDVYSQGSILVITWEPWYPLKKEGIDFDGLISGSYDDYIKEFALRIKKIGKPVFLRFGHEMNGDWYPWSGTKIGKEKYIQVYRHVKDVFDRSGADNVKWIFSFNWEDLPKENNHFTLYYPGDAYVDYLGIDGYNWGNTRPWSRWMSFGDIFGKRYAEAARSFNKPILISEFSSTGSGGDKKEWIKQALNNIKSMKKVTGFVLFNVDKETDWSFPADKDSGKVLKEGLKSSYFK